MVNHLKQWWALHSTWFSVALYFFVPSIQAWVNTHPKTVAASIISTVLVAILQKSPLQKVLPVLIATALFLSGCSGYKTAETAYHVLDGIVAVAQADLPSLTAAGIFAPQESVNVGHYLTVVAALNDQYKSCIDNAQNTKLARSGKFLDCLNLFSAGLADPKELAGLRILNPNAQKRVQLYVAAFQIGINTAISLLGGQTSPAPSIGVAPTSAELQNLRMRVFNGR